MRWRNNPRLLRGLRVLHRDLGFFTVGVCIIYGVSGFLLNHMDGKDPAYHSRQGETVIEKGLPPETLGRVWTEALALPPVKKVTLEGAGIWRVRCEGGMGRYDAADGSLSYEVHRKRPFVYWINRLHYNRVAGWNIMGDLFAFSLLFFAVSGLFMVRGKAGIAGRGKWFLAAGLVIPILYLYFA